jgi:hypothetical protein
MIPRTSDITALILPSIPRGIVRLVAEALSLSSPDPEELPQRLIEATREGRSLSAEIRERLEASFARKTARDELAAARPSWRHRGERSMRRRRTVLAVAAAIAIFACAAVFGAMRGASPSARGGAASAQQEGDVPPALA